MDQIESDDSAPTRSQRLSHLDRLQASYGPATQPFKWLGKKAGGNLAVTFAFGGLVLYLAGLTQRLAQFQADGVNAARGVPLLPLQNYLVEGIAVVLDLQFLFAVISTAVAGALVYAVLHASPSSEHQPEKTVLSRLGDVAACVGGAVVVVFMPLSIWLPPLFAGVVVWLAIAGWRVLTAPPDELAEWMPLHKTAVALATTFGLALSLLAYGYANPPPLDHAQIRLASGGATDGKLLAQTNGSVYLVGELPEEGDAPVAAIPTSEIRRMRITDGEERYSKTLPELLGIDLWRIDVEGRIERIH